MVDEFKQQAIDYLQDESQLISALFAKIERFTNVKREHLACVTFGMFSIYLIVGYFAHLVCNFIGLAYPAYVSMLAIESPDKSDDTQWLTYWTVFAVFSLIDFGAERICGWFPIYWLLKCLFLVYLYHPLTMGAKNVYINYVRPFLQKFDMSGNIAEEAIQQNGQVQNVQAH